MKNLAPSPEEAAQELLKRRRARVSLPDFAKAIDIPGKPVSEEPEEWIFLPVETGLAAHHALILDVLEKVITGALPRAMLFLPPGSAKSTYGSVVAPVWAMGKYPGTKIILASYGSDLAKKHGRRARQVARSPEFSSFFGTQISSDTSAADEWALTNGSEYMALGILSGVTGNRAHGLIIDDPVKGRLEADSETVTERTWNAYQEDLRTRLIPNGWEVIIQTRWSDNDLAGRILPEDYEGESGLIRCRDDRDWYIVCPPALCERDDDPIRRKPGDYLWPEWFHLEHWISFQQNPRTWNALFQQRPQPEQGTFFQRDWFKRFKIGEHPRNLSVYGASDYAVTDAGGDFTEHGIIGVDHDNDLWVLDWWSGQKEADVWIDRQLDLMAKHKPFGWFGESGVIRRAIAPFLYRRMMERKVCGRVEWITSIADKVTKARAFQGRAVAGKVHIPEGPVGDAIIDQLLRFPTGKNDDKVDVFSIFCLALDQANPAVLRAPILQKSEADAHIDAIERFSGGSGSIDEYNLWAQEIEDAFSYKEKAQPDWTCYNDVDDRDRRR